VNIKSPGKHTKISHAALRPAFDTAPHLGYTYPITQ
jgi:hypothetical protein